MIKTVVLDDIDKVLHLLCEQEKIESIDRYRNSYLYRGMHNADWRIMTSLRRNCKDKQQELEPVILRNFTKYAVNDDPKLEESVWRQMIVGRHHGLPTRLLDWSRSPLIGLHFATNDSNLDSLAKHNGVVWRIDMEELHGLLPKKYQDALESLHSFMMPLDILDEVASGLDKYDADMRDCAMVVVEPPSISTRIINQYSYFSLVPNGIDDIEGFLDKYTERTVRYIISKDIKWRVRDMLDQLNVNERIVYPGLDGLTKWLARRYYVKNGNNNN